jgi:hypothetical protein
MTDAITDEVKAWQSRPLKEVLGLGVTHNEGAKFWLQVLTYLKNRGVKDIFIACVGGLKGFPEAIEAAYPNTEVQLCIVRLLHTASVQSLALLISLNLEGKSIDSQSMRAFNVLTLIAIITLPNSSQSPIVPCPYFGVAML